MPKFYCVCELRGLACGKTKKPRSKGPWPDPSGLLLAHGVIAHRAALEHFHAHYVNCTLVGIDVSAELHVMAFMALQFFRVHDVPALLVFVVDERILIAFRLHHAL